MCLFELHQYFLIDLFVSMLRTGCLHLITEILEPGAICSKATTEIPEQLQLTYLFIFEIKFYFFCCLYCYFEHAIVSWHDRKFLYSFRSL